MPSWIWRIFWPRTISNLDLYAKTHSEPIRAAIKKRRLRWLGHVSRMSPNRITRVALRWTPQVKRKLGRPKTPWRRTVDKAMGLTWGDGNGRSGQNWLEAKIGGLMLRAELRERRRTELLARHLLGI